MSHNIPMQQPKHEDGFHVLELGRVSTPMQNESNIEAGYQYAESALASITDAPLVIKRLGEQRSGMIVDAPTMVEAYNLLEQGWPDVVIMEDVSKSYRNPRWIQAFVQDCVDFGVRVIAPGDNLDTFEENWEVNLQTASLRHGLHIPDTRRRVRRTATKAFQEGGMVLRARFGYEKLTAQEAKDRPGHPDNLLIAKRPEDTRIIRHLRHLLVDRGLYGRSVVDWLNDNDIPTGPYVQQDKWHWKHVIDLLRDPILYGLRRFRKVVHKPMPPASTVATRMKTRTVACGIRQRGHQDFRSLYPVPSAIPIPGHLGASEQGIRRIRLRTMPVGHRLDPGSGIVDLRAGH